MKSKKIRKMNTRNQIISQLREPIIGEISEFTSNEEKFQNQTLRPILKMQNELIISIFINYCINQKGTYFKLPVNKKLEYIEQNIQRDMKFRDFLKGIIIALFTLEEYENYSKNASNLNRRIITMLIERLKSQIQIIELPVL